MNIYIIWFFFLEIIRTFIELLDKVFIQYYVRAYIYTMMVNYTTI